MKSFYELLNEAGVQINKSDVLFLNEAQQLQVTDTVLSEMFKFVSEKYNSIDFSEIEKSAGDYRSFKYNKLIYDNLKILSELYNVHDSKIYKKYIADMEWIVEFLQKYSNEISYLYKKDKAIIQILYVSMVVSLIYAISTLISVTIRFVSIDESSEVEVMVEDLSKTSNYAHLRNIEKLAKFIKNGDMKKLIDEMLKLERKSFDKKETTDTSINESIFPITISPTIAALIAVPIVAMLLLKIIPMTREIIYSVYYSRVRIADALELQVNLLRTNIESLETKKFNKKVIVRQKRIATMLELMKNKIALKFDSAEPITKITIREENKKLNIKETPDSGILL